MVLTCQPQFVHIFVKAVEEAKMDDTVRKMQQLKDKEKEDLVSTLQNGQLILETFQLRK